MRFLQKFHIAVVSLTFTSLAWAQATRAPVGPITSALSARDFDKAIELSRQVLQQFPDNAQVWALQGIALASKGDNKEALASFQHALKISPDYAAALAGSAQILYQRNDPKAIPILNHMLEVRPGDPTAHAMLAVLEYREGNCKVAVGHFEKAGDL